MLGGRSTELLSWFDERHGLSRKASSMTGRLDEKVVLLTGVSSGMGRETARLFLEEGATVIGCDLDVAGAEETLDQIGSLGGRFVVHCPVDLTQRDEVATWIEGAGADHGQIDVLYNNASAPRFGPFSEQSDDDYRFTLQNELDLVWLACHVAWPYLAANSGSIVNIASCAGLQGARSLPQAAHAAAKGGVLALTRQLAAEGMSVGIRVNSVSPGVIATPPVMSMYAALGEDAPVAPIVERTLTGQPGDPLGVAYAGLYLASDEASWVTGTNIIVDGGASNTM